MNVEQLIEKIRTESEFTLKSATIAFLKKLESADPSCIGKIHATLHHYDTEGVKLYKHLDFLFEILAYQCHLPADMERTLTAFVASHPFDYTQMIRESYTDRWPGIARQTSEQLLTYHTSYHALEVALRTNLGTKALGIFVEKNELNQFLQYVLLTSAKYHDYVQWERGHPIAQDGFHTPEEQTAATVVDWLITELLLNAPENPMHACVESFIHYFVKLCVGPGTTLLFGKDTLVNLSTIYFEIEAIVYETALFDKTSNQALIYSIQAAGEVLSAMDKVSAACLDVAFHQASDDAESTRARINNLTKHTSHLIAFFASLPASQKYYPSIDSIINLEAGAIMNVAHTQMEIELHRDSTEAIILRNYIKQGQKIHKNNERDPAELASYLHEVVTDGRIADAFRHTYLGAITTEQDFSGKLPNVCRHIAAKLYQLGYTNEYGESYYTTKRWGGKKRDVSSESLETSPPDLKRSLSDTIPAFVHPFIEARVFEQEVCILGALKDHIYSLEELKQREIIQEILIVSICQPGIRYSNHPDLIHSVESPSPINCRTPLDIMRAETSLARSRYSSFNTVRSTQQMSALCLEQQTSEKASDSVLMEEHTVNTSHDRMFKTHCSDYK